MYAAYQVLNQVSGSGHQVSNFDRQIGSFTSQNIFAMVPILARTTILRGHIFQNLCLESSTADSLYHAGVQVTVFNTGIGLKKKSICPFQ